MRKKNSEGFRKKTERFGKTQDDFWYVFFWCLLLLGFAVTGLYQVQPELFSALEHPCLVRLLTGWYCPGCGGTRALFAILHGDWIRAVCYHPAVAYAVGYLLLYLLWNSGKYLSRGRVKGFSYRNLHLWIGLFLLLCNFVIKNYGLLMKIDLLALLDG